MSDPDVTVAIPTYNREKELLETIRDVLAQSHGNLELLVVDQTPTHRAETHLALEGIRDRRFRYFRTVPPSIPAARNFALRRARAPYVVFFDDDVKMDEDLVEIFLESFRSRPELSAVGGRVLQEGFPVGREVLRFDEYAITHGMFTATEPGFTNAFPGGNCALRVADALSVGGFDERYRGNSFREESDLSLRMAAAGQLIYYEPRAVLTHLAAPYGGSRVKTHIYDNFGFYKNELFFTLRAVARPRLREALRRKYLQYCRSVTHGRARRRRLFFWAGLLAASWRVLFGRRVIAREVAG